MKIEDISIRTTIRPGDLGYVMHRHGKLYDRVFDKDKTVSEIAYELGFKYPQHFVRLFKQRVGHTPNEYRSLN